MESARGRGVGEGVPEGKALTLIDMEEDRTARAVLVGVLAELDR